MQYDKIFSYIEAGKQAGAKCVLGGEKRQGKGYYVDPTGVFSLISSATDCSWLIKYCSIC